MFDPVPVLAKELGIDGRRIEAVLDLLAGSNTVPFIARYRKEATGGLDEVQIRGIEERHAYLVELEERRQAILSSITEQGKLNDELRCRIMAAATKAELEDLYLPYRPKRRTRAAIAREKGLEPLAARILAQPMDGDPRAEARAFIDPGKDVADEDAALEGARDIAAEAISENADVRSLVRRMYAEQGRLCSRMSGDEAQAAKYRDYFDYEEKVATIPSHRFLAVSRAEREGALKTAVRVDEEGAVARILVLTGHRERSPFAGELAVATREGYTRLVAPSVERELRAALKERSDRAAVDVFASNLASLLLAAPLGPKPVMGVDPGLRTGCKCAAVDAAGRFLGHMIFNLVGGAAAVEAGKRELTAFVHRHTPSAVAVGNGTGGREAEKFVREALKEAGLAGLFVVPVSESGASVYSASELAGREFPELDLTVRGAISIARRLQDPLAELVKVEPKSIGVGQYQHDVHQPLLGRKLDEVVESCVNRVGVELNTASAPLLARVAGIGPSLAAGIVAHREKNGVFESRKELLDVPRLGKRAFEQAAGFLRIRGAKNPLDASAVHPERYGLVRGMAEDLGVPLPALVGDLRLADRIDISRYVGGDVGEPTLRDILAELRKPGRDPRETFAPPAFRDDVQTLEDLRAGMELEGVVTNVTAFGAFVDVGVHQDGLVHVSQLADRFIKSPSDVVKAGDRITVRVLDVDLPRRRISLTAKSGAAPAQGPREPGPRQPDRRPDPKPPERKKFSYNPFSDLKKRG
ncbi:MAG: Tex family protein [Deltaproteobacteria bacterium]|nr:Tex family protein [Deltaproteobacteria bacterium]